MSLLNNLKKTKPNAVFLEAEDEDDFDVDNMDFPLPTDSSSKDSLPSPEVTCIAMWSCLALSYLVLLVMDFILYPPTLLDFYPQTQNVVRVQALKKSMPAEWNYPHCLLSLCSKLYTILNIPSSISNWLFGIRRTCDICLLHYNVEQDE
ncbi:hypothetical protein NQZ79_g5771 [Umbelopsis isabellina]|nr:hypothetical protein NQZ79_g5771 [Umbelopsis isabellina]